MNEKIALNQMYAIMTKSVKKCRELKLEYVSGIIEEEYDEYCTRIIANTLESLYTRRTKYSRDKNYQLLIEEFKNRCDRHIRQERIIENEHTQSIKNQTNCGECTESYDN